MAHIELEVHTNDPAEEAAYRAYWKRSADGEGWASSVADVSKAHGISPMDMSRIVKTCGTATCHDLKCPECGAPKVVTGRTDLVKALRLTNVLCSACQAGQKAAAERAAREKQERLRRALLEKFPLRTNEEDLTPDSLTLFEAVALHALFNDPAVEEAGMSTPLRIWPEERPWALPSVRVELERILAEARPAVVFAHPDSHHDAFEWSDGAPTGAFYLGSVSYHLVGTGQPRERAPRLLDALNRVFREGPWPEDWLLEWEDLWDRLVLADACAYLDMKLREHHLEMKQGDGTRAVLADALATFSLGQVYNFIYRAARDSAAYYQRGGVNARQAANSTISRITASVARARAAQWDMKSYGRVWNLPLTAIGETFFNAVMWQPDTMGLTRREVRPPLHAWSTDSGTDHGAAPSSED
ncbi:hypothetical protein [Streptomyces radiopugnans]|uniref:Uncharacterized protein n=1 Tax=Streptomyces radiopugnans TaxID=403935 RepID=A0A1H9KAG3_9ACTN|nr:hypothetical protein [Streptomyces radiopugnans]SEQ96140.1 hypothetical protein SAMN05216481_12216 [Streptomyces radiopugnans]